MKIKFYLNRKSSNGKNAIWCYIRENKNTKAINTGEFVEKELWDNKAHRANLRKTRDTVKKGSLKNLNKVLDAFENKIDEIVKNIRSKDVTAKFQIISDEIKKQFDKKDNSFLAVYDEFIKAKTMDKKVGKQTLLKYKRVKKLLEDYQKVNRERLDFDKITKLFFSKFYSYLIEKKNMINNTAHKNIRFLKTFFIWANDNGYTENNSYRKFKSEWEENEVIYLTENELTTLYDLKLKKDEERLERVRDLFVFQCYTGVRYSDIQNISREDIKNSMWNVRTKKTHQIIEIPLSSYALSILAKYSTYPQPLPVISNQKMNVYLKELCEKAKINEPVKTIQYKGSERIETISPKFNLIGTHTARRTFVSLSLQKGMKPETIMAITGHTTYSMMQRYLKIASEHKREEMDKVWGSPLRVVNTQ